MTIRMLDYPDPRTIDSPPKTHVEPDAARILVVDDDLANRESLSRRLTRRGFSVVAAEDGTAALAAVDTAEAAGTPFDLILLDVMMPGISGLEVLAKLRETRPPTVLPIVMATANDTSADVVAALNAGANDYVTKPLDFHVVMARVGTQLDLRRSIRQTLALEDRLKQRNADLEAANLELRAAAEQTRRDLELAAKVQASFLPREAMLDQHNGVRFAWRYDPCTHVAGDALNICQLDADHVGFYVLDVSGHGVAAALTAVAAARLLAPAHDPDTILVDIADAGGRRVVPPAEVAARMSARFAFNAETVQFLTCFYAVLNTRSLRLDYVSAGHPGPVWLGAGRSPTTLDATGVPLGIAQTYEQGSVQLRSGDRLVLYSDGVSEARPPDDADEVNLFGVARLTELLVNAGLAGESLEATLDHVRATLETWRGGAASTDDVSLLALECE